MTDQARVLDVRTLAPAQRHLEILRAFDALRPGDAFILVNDHDPKPLLYTFQVAIDGIAGPEAEREALVRRLQAV